MENEIALLERLRQHDPKVFRTVFEEFTEEMIEQATQILGNYVMGNTIVTRVWYNALESSFENVKLPLRNYFFDQIRIHCEIMKMVGPSDLAYRSVKSVKPFESMKDHKHR